MRRPRADEWREGLRIWDSCINMDRGVGEADLEMAISYYRQGAALGDSASENNLGVIAEDSPARDYKLAMDHYKKAAAAGNAMAMSNLGFLYLNGRGVSAR